MVADPTVMTTTPSRSLSCCDGEEGVSVALLWEAVRGSDGVYEADTALGESCCCRCCFSITEGGVRAYPTPPASSGNDGRGGEVCGAELDNLSDGERAVGNGGAWAAPPPPTQSHALPPSPTESCIASLPNRVVSLLQSAT